MPNATNGEMSVYSHDGVVDGMGSYGGTGKRAGRLAAKASNAVDYVLQAIGKAEAAHHSVRCQIGRNTSEAQIDAAVQLLVAGVRRMRTFAL